MPASPDTRRHTGASGKQETEDTRSPGQKDRDRILYTSAFRRLAGVTQVVGALEGHIFHNRLTHTLEVAQIARRTAERFCVQYRDELAHRDIRLDPDVAEAAALAHDLGHPPFGHVAEKELDRCLAESETNIDGYEGNAQSFRIVTRLASHRQTYPGLDLTRATLDAILKYPWLRDGAPASKSDKFGAYRSELEDFAFAREGAPPLRKSLEAEIMDHADAVAYSVHDLDDFYRAGLISLEDIHADFTGQLARLKGSGKVNPGEVDEYRDELARWFALFPRARYTGDNYERTALRALGAKLIHGFVSEITLAFDESGWPTLDVPPLRAIEIRFLQNLVWTHVIQSPRLATQQHGQRKIIRELYAIYREALGTSDARSIVPGAFRRQVDTLDAAPEPDSSERAAGVARLAADIVASFTDAQAVSVYRRLTGVAPGSITDLIEI